MAALPGYRFDAATNRYFALAPPGQRAEEEPRRIVEAAATKRQCVVHKSWQGPLAQTSVAARQACIPVRATTRSVQLPQPCSITSLQWGRSSSDGDGGEDGEDGDDGDEGFVVSTRPRSVHWHGLGIFRARASRDDVADGFDVPEVRDVAACARPAVARGQVFVFGRDVVALHDVATRTTIRASAEHMQHITACAFRVLLPSIGAHGLVFNETLAAHAPLRYPVAASSCTAGYWTGSTTADPLWVGHRDGDVRLFDLRSHESKALLAYNPANGPDGVRAPITWLRSLRDGRYAVVHHPNGIFGGFRPTALIDTRFPGKAVELMGAPVFHSAPVPSLFGDWLALASSGMPEVSVVDALRPGERRRLKLPGEPSAFALTSERSLVAQIHAGELTVVDF